MKSKRIRDVVVITHRYIGLAIGILAAAIGLTGSLLSLDAVIAELFAPKVTPIGTRLSIAALVSRAKTAFPDLQLESLQIPKSLTESITVWWLGKNDQWTKGFLNPYTGAIDLPPQSDRYTSLLYDIHIALLGGDWGAYLTGVVGLLATILCLTGVLLWPGWRKLAAGFKIKWNANVKRLNFDLHKVAGIIAAAFLAMAMFTGFIWNFGTWTEPLIYAVTFSPKPAEAELASQAIGNQPPLPFTEALFQTADMALPAGEVTSIYLPLSSEGVIRVNKELPNRTASVILDQFSGTLLKVEGLSSKSLASRLYEWFTVVHYGTFAGVYFRIFYIFVGLSPMILLITGFIMWRLRERSKPQHPVELPAPKNYS